MTARTIKVPVQTRFGGTVEVAVTLSPAPGGGVSITADAWGWRRTAEIPAQIAETLSKEITAVLLAQRAAAPVKVR